MVHSARAPDPPRRHGRVLRVRRAARRPVAPRQAASSSAGGRGAASSSAASYEVRRVRRALGDADGGGAPALPARHRRRAAHEPVRRGERGGVRDLPPLHAARAGALARRGVPRRDREPVALRRRQGDRAADQGRGARASWAHGVGGRRAVQVRGEDRERSGEAGRARGRARTTSPRSSRRCRSSGCGGSGRRRRPRLRALGFATLGDLARARPKDLERALGTWGAQVSRLARGEDDRGGRSRTGSRSPSARSRPTSAIRARARTSSGRSSCTRSGWRSGWWKRGSRARVVVVKLKYADFTLRTRRATLLEPVLDATSIHEAAASCSTGFHRAGTACDSPG